MPQYNSYPTAGAFLEADLVLFFQSSSGACKIISGEDFAASIKALTDRSLTVNLVNSATVLDPDYEFVVGNSASTFTVTLPGSALNPGLQFYISNKGAGAMTIAPNGSDTIAGASSLSLTQYHSVVLISDGVGMWHVFGVAN